MRNLIRAATVLAFSDLSAGIASATEAIVNTDAASEVRLPAGSWYRIPAGFAHVSACVSAADCVTFLYQDGRFDFLPVASSGAVEQ